MSLKQSSALGNQQTQNVPYPVNSGDAVNKAYADELVVGLLDDRGNFDASSNTFPATGGSGYAGAILKGDLWYIVNQGTLGGVLVVPGSVIRALVDNPGQTGSNWGLIQNELGYVPAHSGANGDITSLSGLTGSELFATSSTPTTPAAGHGAIWLATDSAYERFRWIDETGKTFTFNRDIVYMVKNTTASPITPGQACYANGTDGVSRVTVALSKMDLSATASCLGIAIEPIAVNGYGRVMRYGQINNIDTSYLTSGQAFYISDATAGRLTTTAPTSATSYIQRIGTCVVSNATTGVLEIAIRSAFPVPAYQPAGTTAGTYAAGDDTRITSYGIPIVLDGGYYALRTNVMAVAKVGTGNGTIVTVASTAHGLNTYDDIYIDSSSATNVLPTGFYTVTRLTADTFSVPYVGTASTSNVTYSLAVKGELEVRTKFHITSVDLRGDVGTATVKVWYATSITTADANTWTEINGGSGVAISSNKSATVTLGTPVDVAQYGYLKFQVTVNGGANSTISIGFKGSKIV